jgi:hypothetical protein
MIVLRNLDGYTCDGAYLYSQTISMPQNIPVAFLFGVGTYNSTEMSAWIASLTNTPGPQPTVTPTPSPTRTPGPTPTVTQTPSPSVSPVVKSISPAIGVRGTTVLFTLSGQNFGKSPEITLQRNGTIIKASSVTVLSTSKLKGKFIIPASTAISQWIVVVRQGSLMSNKNVKFTVRSRSRR